MIRLLRMTGAHHAAIRDALYPGDGKEAVVFSLCGRCDHPSRQTFVVRALTTLRPEHYLERRRDRVTWFTEVLPPLLNEAARHGLTLLKLHSHPGGWAGFSERDDLSDQDLAGVVASWTGNPRSAALSVIVPPDAGVRGRIAKPDGSFVAIDGIDVIGDDLDFDRRMPTNASGFGSAFRQAFGGGTFARMRQLRFAIVGCSGTGSLVIEQLARNGAGSLVLVDPDVVEDRNLDRILHATAEDATRRRPKVEVLKAAIEAIGTGTEVEAVPLDLFTPTAVRAVASADVVFGCVDTVDARHLLNRLAAFYVLPYFDVGVKLEADGKGGIEQVCGGAHYIKPGGSSLLSRGVYTLEDVRAAGQLREDPKHYADQVRRGYIRGVIERRPAVISVNMLVASLTVNDFLARIHPYRIDPNARFAQQRISLSHGLFDAEPDGEPCSVTSRNLGRGDVVPLLDLPELTEE